MSKGANGVTIQNMATQSSETVVSFCHHQHKQAVLYFNCVFIYLFILKYGTLHEFACHPCAGAMLIFSVSFQF